MPELPELIGNDAVRARLWRAAADDRLHHCFLFEGPAGVGKFNTAVRFAMATNCVEPLLSAPEPGLFGPPPPSAGFQSRAPCGVCPSCRSILAGTHPDVLIVQPDPERATRILSIDQARAVVAALTLQRHSARRRFVILDPADLLNEEAANALLKTLEEPPAGTQFILVTARGAGILPTVRSRSQRVRFGAVPTEALAAWLQQKGHDPSLADRADGSVGRALALAEEAEAQRALRDALLGAIGQPLHRLFAFTEELGKKESGGSKADVVVDLLEELLRDVVLVANGRRGADARLRHPDQLPLLSDWARALWPNGIGRLSGAIVAARERLLSNVNGRVVLEALLSTVNLELAAMPRRG